MTMTPLSIIINNNFKNNVNKLIAVAIFLPVFLLSFAAIAKDFPLKNLTIITSKAAIPFTVEMAETDEQQERGLMFRRDLPEKHGMFFPFHTHEPIMMWMKNTYIPLDMLFIDSAGVIVYIEENTEPQSTRIIASPRPASAVLELGGGSAGKYGIKPGDKVVFP